MTIQTLRSVNTGDDHVPPARLLLRARVPARVTVTSMRRVGALLVHELRILRSDPAPLAVLLVIPIVLIALLQPAYAKAGAIARSFDVTGSAQAVTGMAVTFGFNVVGILGFGFLRDHSWRTWDRLRASQLSGLELVLGKMAAPFLAAVGQFVLLFGLGVLVFDLRVRGSPVALGCVGLAVALCLVAIGLVLAAFCKTTGQVYATTNVAGLLLAGAGGAIVPSALLPQWIRTLAVIDPASWAMRAYHHVIVERGGIVAVLPSLLALASLSIVLVSVAVVRFRFEEAKLV